MYFLIFAFTTVWIMSAFISYQKRWTYCGQKKWQTIKFWRSFLFHTCNVLINVHKAFIFHVSLAKKEGEWNYELSNGWLVKKTTTLQAYPTLPGERDWLRTAGVVRESSSLIVKIAIKQILRLVFFNWIGQLLWAWAVSVELHKNKCELK